MPYIKIDKIKNSNGFTLIEVIVSLVIAGILGAMLFAFMGTSMMKSANPVLVTKDGAYLNMIVENMNAGYRALQADKNDVGPVGLDKFKKNVESTTPYYYDLDQVDEVKADYISFANGTPVTATSAAYNPNNSNILQVTVTYKGLTVTTLFGG
ncbi:MAG: prepilin-type N-terminal cleavage/methylation domain-containing protein [Syntrophaceae bacterium]|nr:prepilin-type N-terminal cleavage/methylation domain-containing protein [Syntrophaceae bacterium]